MGGERQRLMVILHLPNMLRIFVSQTDSFCTFEFILFDNTKVLLHSTFMSLDASLLSCF